MTPDQARFLAPFLQLPPSNPQKARGQARCPMCVPPTQSLPLSTTETTETTETAETDTEWPLAEDPDLRTDEELWAYALSKTHTPLIGAAIKRYRRGSVQREDLEQAGRIGLFLAAQRYLPGKGASFKSYAVYWIRAEINVALNRGASGPHVSQKLRDHAWRCRKLKQASAVSLSIPQLAALLNCTETMAAKAQDYAEMWLVCLDKPTNDSGQWPNFLRSEAPSEDDVCNFIDDLGRLAMVMEGLNSLNADDPDTYYVLVQYYGLFGHQARTVRALAAERASSCRQIRYSLTAGRRYLLRWLSENRHRRSEVYAAFVANQREHSSAQPSNINSDGDWIVPRSTVEQLLANLIEEAKADQEAAADQSAPPSPGAPA